MLDVRLGPYLDKLQVEQERGITVKAQTASMRFTFDGCPHLLNLIDTPGHVDFARAYPSYPFTLISCLLFK